MTATAEVSGEVAVGPTAALADLLGVRPPEPEAGLPLLWHWVHLLDRPALVDLGADGHPARHALVDPPGGGRRRMWAGGLVVQHRPLRPGPATRTSRVVDQEDKDGRAGPMTLVTVAHEVTQAGEVAVTEEQHLVYLDTGPASAPRVGEPEVRGREVVELDVGPVVLFRFSALTWNAHRIHYDQPWATGVEGHPGLVVHGPLQAIAMAEAARRLGGDPAGPVRFDYRLVSPMYADEGLLAHADPGDGDAVVTRVTTRAGRLTGRGTLRPA